MASKTPSLSSYFKKGQTAQVREVPKVTPAVVSEMYDLFAGHPLHGEELARRAFYCAWYDGYQNVKIAKTRDKLIINQNYRKGLRYRSRGNILKRNGRDAISMLIKDDPIGTAIPTDSTHQSRQSAQVSNELLQYSYNRPDLCIMRKKYLAAENAYKMGTGWIGCKWNPNAFFYNPNSNIWERVGDVQITCHDDFDIFPDNTAKTWSEVNWIFHVYLQDIEVVRKLYPDFKGEIKEYTLDSPDETRHLYRPNYYWTGKQAVKKQCLIAEYYEKPILGIDEILENGDDKKEITKMSVKERQKYFGKRRVLVNWEHVLSDSHNPYYEFGQFLCLPFVPVFWFANSHCLHGSSPLKEQIPRQYEYSKLNSIISESAFFLGIPRIFVPKGSGLRGRKIDDDPRTFVETIDGKVNVARPPSLPAYISNQRDFVSMEAQRDANTGSMAFGELPTGFSGSSGSALRQLMSRQLGKYAPEVEDIKITTKILSLLILNNYKTFMPRKRFINILGPDKRYKIKAFEKIDLQGDVDLFMAPTSAYRNSPAAKAELAINLSDRGIFQAAQAGDPSAIMLLNTLEFGDISELTRTHNLHRDKAEWVIEKIKKDQAVPDVYPFDNHFIHLEMIQREFANPQFEEQPDTVKKALAGRAQLHMMYIQQSQQAQMGPGPQQGAGPGGPPGPPPSPQNTENNVAAMGGGAIRPTFGQM